MKIHTKFPAIAAICLALAPLIHAQVQTYQTVSNYAGTSNFSVPSDPIAYQSDNTAGETFTNLYGISSLTYNFFGSPAANTTLSAEFAVWNGSGDNFDPANYVVVHDFGTFTVNQFVAPNANGWTTLTNGHGSFNTFAQQFDFSNLAEDSNPLTSYFETSPSATYALLVTNTTGTTTNFGIGFSGNSFSFGTALIGVGSVTQDYTFSQIAVVTTDPVPESSTIASVLALVLVAGLVIFRLRQRKQQLETAPAMAS